MTPKQEKFVQGVIKGLSNAQAYREAYPGTKMSDEAIAVEASNMINGTGKYKKNPKIALRYSELNKKIKQKAEKKTIADAQEILETLTAMFRDGNIEPRDRIKCADLLGKRLALFTEQLHITNEKPLVVIDDLK